jgi:hypothetical protein
MSPAPDPARHDRAKAIGADGEACANCPPAAGGISEHRATHGAVFIKESFQTHTIQHLSASAAGRVNQLLVEIRLAIDKPAFRVRFTPARANSPVSRLPAGPMTVVP